MNILKQAHGIIYEKSEEKERQYGDFFENMEDAAKIASVMSKKQLTAEDIYHALIGLKFARESFTHKHDNMLDAIAYLASLHEYKEAKISKIKDYEVVDPIIVKDKKKEKKHLVEKFGHGGNYYNIEFDNQEKKEATPEDLLIQWCNEYPNTGTVNMSFAHMTDK